MAVAAQNVAPQFVANPGQTVFVFAWRCDDPATVLVWVNDVQDGGFAVALNADQIGAPGGSITRGVACLGGEVVTVERKSPLTQTTALVRYGPFPAGTVTALMDIIVEMVQEVWALLGRMFRVSRANAAKMSTLDWPTPSLGQFVYFADGGGGLLKLGAASLDPNTFRMKENEVVARTSAGVYTLAFLPTDPTRVKVYLNGVRQLVGVNYTLVGKVITFLANFIPDAPEVVLADYPY
jgi:hypothetical protein